MTQNELLKSISLQTGHKYKVVADIMQAYVRTASEEFKTGGSVRLHKLGVLRSIKSQPRNGYNPVSRKSECFRGRNGVKFIPSTTLKKEINPNGNND